MVTAFVTMILLAQLWLFSVTLDMMASRDTSAQAAVAALICSFLACAAVWALIRFFMKSEI
jgi:hypothetical protein